MSEEKQSIENIELPERSVLEGLEGSKNRTKMLLSYVGNKTRITPVIWRGLGRITRFTDPFAGSGSVYFTRPKEVDAYVKNVVMGDASGLVSNYLRAVVHHYDFLYGFFENHIHDEWRHAAAKKHVKEYDLKALEAGLLSDPNWCDKNLAACWMLMLSASIMDGFGIQATGVAVDPKRVLDWRSDATFTIRHGDWKKTVRKSFLQTYDNNRTITGVVLDPPYGGTENYYDSATKGLSQESYEWAVEKASERVRVAYCCYSDHFPCPEGWVARDWTGATFGFSKSGAGRKEVVYFSPHSETPQEWLEHEQE